MSEQLITIDKSVALTNQAWGTEGTSKEDLLIPRVQMMHDISDLVKKQKAQAGSLIHSTTNEVLAARGGAMEFIPLSTFREWIINDVDEKGRDKYRCRLPMTAQNENWAKEDTEGGQLIRRVKCLNFFGLIPNRMDELPFLVSFRKSSLFAGKKLSTHFQMSAMKKRPPAAQVFTIGAVEKTYDGFTFFVFNVEPARSTTPEELKTARSWYELLNSSNVEIADESQAEAPPF